MLILFLTAPIQDIKNKRTHRMRPSTHPHNSHPGPIPPKSPNIFSHPLKQHSLIPKSQIQTPFSFRHRRRGESQRADTIIKTYRQQWGLGPANETSHISLGTAAGVEGAAVDVDDDGESLLCRGEVAGGPVYIQIETILAFPCIDDRRGSAGTNLPKDIRLDTAGITSTGNIIRRQRNRWSKTIRATSSLRIGNPPPRFDGTRHQST